MPIEDIVVSLDGGTAAAESGRTYNNFTGIGSTGVFDSDLSGYTTGAATGVSIATSHTTTGSANGRLQGVDTRTQEVNREGAYSNPGTSTDVTFTVTFPAAVTSVDVEVFNCTDFASQTALALDVNGATATVNSSDNTTGTTSTFTGVVPNGSDQVLIVISNPDEAFIYHNGFRFYNIVDGAGGSTIARQIMQYLN